MKKTNETQCTTLCLLLYTQPSPTKQGWIQFVGFLSFQYPRKRAKNYNTDLACFAD